MDFRKWEFVGSPFHTAEGEIVCGYSYKWEGSSYVASPHKAGWEVVVGGRKTGRVFTVGPPAERVEFVGSSLRGRRVVADPSYFVKGSAFYIES